MSMVHAMFAKAHVVLERYPHVSDVVRVEEAAQLPVREAQRQDVHGHRLGLR